MGMFPEFGQKTPTHPPPPKGVDKHNICICTPLTLLSCMKIEKKEEKKELNIYILFNMTLLNCIIGRKKEKEKELLCVLLRT